MPNPTQQDIEFALGKSALKHIRRKLSRGLHTKGSNGFEYDQVEYDQVFGCERDRTHVCPYIRVRVELRSDPETSDMYRFEVFVDFSLPLMSDVESAEHFKDAACAAVKKAKWAEKLVAGYAWHRSILLSEG